MPYCAEESESLIFTSAMESKIGVLMTLLLMGELVETPSSKAFENGMLPLTDTPPIPGLEVVAVLRCASRARQQDDKLLPIGCSHLGQSVVRVSLEIVVEISAVAVSSRGAAVSWITTVWVDCPRVNCDIQTRDPGGQRHGSALHRGEALFLKGDQVAVRRNERAGIVQPRSRS